VHHPADLGGIFFFQDAQGIRGGIAHVNDQGLAGLLGRGNVLSETFPLLLKK
jgi:hypothetical protein